MSGHNKNKKLYSLLGYFIFFITVMAIITVAITVFVAINRESEGNQTIIAIVMILVVVFLSATCTIIDYLRRKYTMTEAGIIRSDQNCDGVLPKRNSPRWSPRTNSRQKRKTP